MTGKQRFQGSAMFVVGMAVAAGFDYRWQDVVATAVVIVLIDLVAHYRARQA